MQATHTLIKNRGYASDRQWGFILINLLALFRSVILARGSGSLALVAQRVRCGCTSEKKN
jgi:hypothetical protein